MAYYGRANAAFHALRNNFRSKVQTKSQIPDPIPDFHGVARRYYSVNRDLDLIQMKKNWYEKNKLMVWLVGSVALVAYFGFETVPYSKRKHFLLFPGYWEGNKVESQSETRKKHLFGNVLPESDKQSRRVKRILKKIIGALEKNLNDGTILVNNKEYLQGLKWDIFVLDTYSRNRDEENCLPGAKIAVSKIMLEQIKSDDELALIIAHRVAHVLARHDAEGYTKSFLFIPPILLYLIALALVVFDRSQKNMHILIICGCCRPDALFILLMLAATPFLNKMEKEADHIGLMLMASAGYNPNVAPSLYERLGKVFDDDKPFYKTTWNKRARLLAKEKVMKEANKIYNANCNW